LSIHRCVTSEAVAVHGSDKTPPSCRAFREQGRYRLIPHVVLGAAKDAAGIGPPLSRRIADRTSEEAFAE